MSPIRTERLLIRFWTPEDAPLLKEAIDTSLDHLRPWMEFALQEPTPLPELAERLAKFHESSLAGADRDGSRPERSPLSGFAGWVFFLLRHSLSS